MKASQSSFEKICLEIQEQTSSGGGFASGLTGALAVSLLAKVMGKTSKKKSAKNQKIFKQLSGLLASFQKLAEEDKKAFAQFLKDSQNIGKIEKIIKIPLEMAQKSLLILELSSSLIKKGNQKMVADSHCALELGTAVFYGSMELVRANLPLLGKSQTEEEIRDEMEELLNQAEAIIKP